MKVKIIRRLGVGGYGEVHECKDETGTSYAIKTIKMPPSGITCLMETVIMNSIGCEYINTAERTFIKDDSLKILMKCADRDLHDHKHMFKITDDQLKKWSFQLVQALCYLHDENIIHGDIKAANIFLFGNDVKLGDFTLSQRMWLDDSPFPFSHNVCTITHRPLEVLRGENWGSGVDIWALGCTLYELYSRGSLFPYQGKDGEEENGNMINATINCILDWLDTIGEKTDIPRPVCQGYRRPNWNPPSDPLFRDLILKMLTVNKMRPSIKSFLNHPYFEGMNPTPSSIITPRITRVLNTDLFRRISAEIDTSNLQNQREVIKTLGLCLYSKVQRRISGDETFLIRACLLLGSKLTSICKSLSLPTYYAPGVIAMEQAVCEHLGFAFLFETQDLLKAREIIK